jgi:indolepyruvate ferredoxin oxidoreductase
VTNRDWQFPGSNNQRDILDALGGAQFAANAGFVDAGGLATKLMGDAIYTNPFVMGYAWQKGWVPLSYEALLRAIELNGVAIEANKKAFEWGRFTAHDLAAVKRIAEPEANVLELKRLTRTLDELLIDRVRFLSDYQDAAYSVRYSALVDKVRRVEEKLGSTKLTEAVARYFFKLMAYKDEYEVARLYTETGFIEKIKSQFEGDYKLNFYLAPPLLAKRNDKGELTKKQYGPWMFSAFKLLAKMRKFRGTALDVFGYTAERKTERALIGEYEQMIEAILPKLSSDNLSIALQLASLPEEIRGYGHVKEAALAKARTLQSELLARFKAPVIQIKQVA